MRPAVGWVQLPSKLEGGGEMLDLAMVLCRKGCLQRFDHDLVDFTHSFRSKRFSVVTM